MMDKNGLIEKMKLSAALKPRKVTVDGWGDLYVKALTVAEVQENTGQDGDERDKRTLAIGAARVICDENGDSVFKKDDKGNYKEEDIALLQSQPWVMLSQVITAAGDVNGYTEKGKLEAKKG
jgi:hypothetical protein